MGGGENGLVLNQVLVVLGLVVQLDLYILGEIIHVFF